MDREKLEKVLERYPLLATLLLAGVLSFKMTRELLDIDRWLMQDVYKELILAEAVVGTSSSCFKATASCLLYLQERRLRDASKDNESV